MGREVGKEYAEGGGVGGVGGLGIGGETEEAEVGGGDDIEGRAWSGTLGPLSL